MGPELTPHVAVRPCLLLRPEYSEAQLRNSFMFSVAGSLLLDSQVPSSPQFSAGNFFFTLDS